MRRASRYLQLLAEDEVPTREVAWLAAAMAVGLAVRVAYVLLTRHYALAGDAPEYDLEGQMIAHGHLFWTSLPYGVEHAGAWKAPGYPAWVGVWYTLLGHHPTAVRLVQVTLGAMTILLSWLFARRLFGARVAVVAAAAVALYPLAWQYEELLYPESLATPLTLAVLIVVVTGAPSRRRAVLAGVLVGISLLVRPSGEFLVLGALIAWGVSIGWGRGIGLAAIAALSAALVVAPWTVRNAIVMHGFVPISLQDAALYGTFNSVSAHDPVSPYGWRREPPDVVDLFNPRHPLSDVKLRSALIRGGLSYISAHPDSLFAAFFWNGLSRLWDIRRRSNSLAEVPFEGRSRFVSEVGLDLYDVLLPLALMGLWRARRRRRSVVFGVIALALGASITFTVEGGTRYRATLEPLIVVFAVVGALGVREAPRLRVASRPG